MLPLRGLSTSNKPLSQQRPNSSRVFVLPGQTLTSNSGRVRNSQQANSPARHFQLWRTRPAVTGTCELASLPHLSAGCAAAVAFLVHSIPRYFHAPKPPHRLAERQPTTSRGRPGRPSPNPTNSGSQHGAAPFVILALLAAAVCLRRPSRVTCSCVPYTRHINTTEPAILSRTAAPSGISARLFGNNVGHHHRRRRRPRRRPGSAATRDPGHDVKVRGIIIVSHLRVSPFLASPLPPPPPELTGPFPLSRNLPSPRHALPARRAVPSGMLPGVVRFPRSA